MRALKASVSRTVISAKCRSTCEENVACDAIGINVVFCVVYVRQLAVGVVYT